MINAILYVAEGPRCLHFSHIVGYGLLYQLTGDQSLLVDFSKASGQDVLLATTLPAKEGVQVKAGKTKVSLLFPPEQRSP